MLTKWKNKNYHENVRSRKLRKMPMAIMAFAALFWVLIAMGLCNAVITVLASYAMALSLRSPVSIAMPRCRDGGRGKHHRTAGIALGCVGLAFSGAGWGSSRCYGAIAVYGSTARGQEGLRGDLTLTVALGGIVLQ